MSATDFLERLFYAGFPVDTSSKFFYGFKTGIHAVRSYYVSSIIEELKPALLAAGGPLQYPYLLASLKYFESTATVKSIFTVASREVAYAAAAKYSRIPKTVTFTFDSSQLEAALRSSIRAAADDWKRKFIDGNLYLAPEAKAMIEARLDSIFGKPFNIWQTIYEIETGTQDEVEQPLVELKLPTNAIGTVKRIQAVIDGKEGQRFFSPIVGGHSAWLVRSPGFAARVLGLVTNPREPQEPVVTLNGQLLIEGKDYFIRNGVLELKSPLKAPGKIEIKAWYVHGLIQDQIKEYSKYFSGHMFGIPPTTEGFSHEEAEFFITSGISPALWELAVDELFYKGTERGMFSLSDLSQDQLDRLIEGLYAIQKALDSIAFLAYIEDNFGLPSNLAATRIPNIPIFGYKWLGFLHIFDDRPKLRAKMFEGQVESGVKALVESVLTGTHDVLFENIDEFMDAALSMVESKEDYILFELDRNGISRGELYTYLDVVKIYVLEGATEWIYQAVRSGGTRDEILGNLEKRVDALLEDVIKRCWKSQDEFKRHAEFLDMVFVKAPLPIYRPSISLHKPETDRIKDVVSDKWAAIREKLANELELGMRDANIQNLPDSRVVLASIIEDLYPVLGNDYSLLKWADIAARAKPPRRTSIRTYVEDILASVGELAESLVSVMSTASVDKVWFGSLHFELDAISNLNRLADSVRLYFIGPQLKSHAASYEEPVQFFVANILDQEFPTWRSHINADQILNDCTIAVIANISLDPIAREILSFMQDVTTKSRATHTLTLPELALKLENRLFDNPMFRQIVIERFGIVEAGYRYPTTIPEDPVMYKWRASVMATIADYQSPSVDPTKSPRWIPVAGRGATEEEQLAKIKEYQEQGWVGIKNWLSSVLASEYGVTKQEAELFLESYRGAIESMVDNEIDLVRFAFDRALDPTGEKHIVSASQVHTPAGGPIFRNPAAIREEELPAIAQLTALSLLRYVRQLAGVFFSRTGDPTDYSEQEFLALVRLAGYAAVEYVMDQLPADLPLKTRLNVRAEIEATIAGEITFREKNLVELFRSGADQKTLSEHIDYLTGVLRDIGLNRAKKYMDQRPLLERYREPLQDEITASFFLDTGLPDRLRIDLLPNSEIEKMARQIYDYWEGFLLRSTANGVPGQDYSTVFNTINWHEEAKKLLGDAAASIDIDALYDNAKLSFSAQDETALIPIVRAILYQVPISNRLTADGKYVDIEQMKWTCFRALTQAWINYFKDKLQGKEPVIKFQVDLSNPVVKDAKYSELVRSLVKPGGLIRQYQDRVYTALGYSASARFYDQAMGILLRMWNSKFSAVRTISEDEYIRTVFDLTQEFRAELDRIVSEITISSSAKRDFSVYLERIDTLPLETRIMLLREAQLNKTAPGALDIIEKGDEWMYEANLVMSPLSINAVLSNFGEKLSGAIASSSNPQKLSTVNIRELSWDYIQRVYYMTVRVVENARLNPAGSRYGDAREYIVTVDNLDYYAIVKYMYENKLAYPTAKEQADDILDGFRRALQAAQTRPELAFVAKLWPEVHRALFEMHGRSLNPLQSIPWAFKLQVVTELAREVNKKVFMDAWGRAYTFEQARQIANYDWMWQLLRLASAGYSGALERFDTQFELFWKPFMQHESQMRGSLGYLGNVPDYFLSAGNRLLEMRRTIVDSSAITYVRPDYKTAFPDDDPIRTTPEGIPTSSAWYIYKITVEYVDGTIKDVELVVNEENNNMKYVRDMAELKARIDIGFMKSPQVKNIIIKSYEKVYVPGAGFGGGGGKSW